MHEHDHTLRCTNTSTAMHDSTTLSVRPAGVSVAHRHSSHTHTYTHYHNHTSLTWPWLHVVMELWWTNLAVPLCRFQFVSPQVTTRSTPFARHDRTSTPPCTRARPQAAMHEHARPCMIPRLCQFVRCQRRLSPQLAHPHLRCSCCASNSLLYL